MQIEIRLANGRVVAVTLPPNTTMSSDQLNVLMGWAVAGKPAPELIVD